MGIALASRCRCSTERRTENADHLFVSSKLAREVWTFFAKILQFNPYCCTLNHLAHVWLQGASLSSAIGICRNIIDALGLWEIWKHRNRIIYEDINLNPREVIC